MATIHSISCLVLVILIICTLTVAAEPPATREVSSTATYDVDHPHPFDASSYPNRDAWQKRADFLRVQAMVAQGLWPMPLKAPLEPVIHGKIARDGYTIEKVFFASVPGHYVTGNLYRPTACDGKLPAVLMPYGHWPNGRFIWRDDAGVKKDIDAGAETDPVAARSPLQANCVQLARMGCVVFHYDMVGYGDSTKIPHREGFTDAESVMRLQSFMGLQTWNGVRALDLITSLPDVDASRIAIAGSSGGGTQAIAMTAVDKDRVAVSFPMVMVSMNMQGGCVCENAPLWRVNTNNVELASLFAPKPQGMAAANDWTHDFLTRGLPEMKSIWRVYDAEDHVEGEHFNFPHNHNLRSRLSQYRFLNKHLKLGISDPIEEKAFDPVPPAELSVYDASHPPLKDQADAPTLRKTMTAASDAQLEKLGGEEYVQDVRAALRAMVIDEKRDLTHTSHHSRMPDTWNGRVVIWWDPNHVEPAAANPLTYYAVYGPLASSSPATSPSTKPKRGNLNPPYPGGMVLGYNRSRIAQETCDLLDLVAQIRCSFPDTKSISLIATGEGAPAALLARALAGEAIDRAAIDLDGFDFDCVQGNNDPRLLPGALKYGGIYGFVPLCDSGPTLIYNARETGSIERARTTANVTIDPNKRNEKELRQWIAEGHQ